MPMTSRLFECQTKRRELLELIDYIMQSTELRNGNSHFSTGNEAWLTDVSYWQSEHI